jgi:hypothetical protein
VGFDPSQLNAEARGLGNYGNKLAPPGQRPEFSAEGWVPGAGRRERLALRERLWHISSIPDVRKCGKVPRVGSVLEVRDQAGGGRLVGLCTCHSVWVCPICAPEIRAARGAEIAAAVAARLGDGGGVTFGTGTLSHSGKHSLRSTYSLVVSAWQSVNVDKSVRKFRSAHSYWGFIRTTEITHGQNGWHPHLHWLDCWESELHGADVIEYRDLVYGAWSRAVSRLSDRKASASRGVVLLPVRSGEAETLGNYLTEMSVNSASFELTSVTTKEARRGGMGPFDILAKVHSVDSKPWVDLWWEYEQSTRGRRMLGSSKGLLARLEIGQEDPVPGECDGDVLATVSKDHWAQLRWCTEAGLSGAQGVIEAAAVAGGQLAVDEAVRLLLGIEGPLPERAPDSVQLELGPGDDGGMF